MRRKAHWTVVGAAALAVSAGGAVSSPTREGSVEPLSSPVGLPAPVRQAPGSGRAVGPHPSGSVAGVLAELERVPPVAWVEGYWVTPVDLGGEGQGASGAAPVDRSLGLVFTSWNVREAVGLPTVGTLDWLDAVTEARPGVFVVPVADPDLALLEYLPPPYGGESSCYYFCGDSATWDFDADGVPNDVDVDDDGDGVADLDDAYPYWPAASECACHGRAYVGVTGKFSGAVTAAVLAAYDRLVEAEQLESWGSPGDGVEVWFVAGDEAGDQGHPEVEPGCRDPEDPRIRYVSRDPEACARLRFRCQEGRVPFSNECGCGCATED